MTQSKQPASINQDNATILPDTMNNSFKSKGGLKRILNASRYSIQGIRAAFKHEAAFRQELLLAIILFPLAFFVGSNAIERLFLIATLCMVLVVELINSAIEALADAISTEFHPLIGRAKDIASAAVMLTLIFTAITWIVIFISRFNFNIS